MISVGVDVSKGKSTYPNIFASSKHHKDIQKQKT